MDVGSRCILDVQESNIKDDWTTGDGNRGDMYTQEG